MECCVAAEPGTEWNGMEWNGMERNGTEWNEMESNKKYILLDFYSTRA